MKKVDLYWQSNREWWEFRNGIPVVRDDAPPEAKESYERHLKQIEEDEREYERRRRREKAGLDW